MLILPHNCIKGGSLVLSPVLAYRGKMLILVLLSWVALTTAQDNIENVEKAENVLKELQKTSGLDLK